LMIPMMGVRLVELKSHRFSLFIRSSFGRLS